MTETLKLSTSDPAEVGAGLDRLISRATLADGQPPFNDQALVDARAGSRTLVLATRGDTIAGAAIIGSGEFEVVVDPEWRRNGLGGILVDRILDGSDPQLAAWAHGDHPASRILAAERGFEAVRTLLQLRMPLAGVAPSAPSGGDGVTIDAFRPGLDDEEWIALNARVFASHPEQGKLTLDDLHARMAEHWFDAADFLVARRDGRLVGYDWLKVEPGEPGEPGEIYVLGVDPEAAGKGLGRALMVAGLARLRERGCDTAALYVEADSEGAVHLYRSLGFTDHTIDVQYRRIS
jgi:mycothiol synthase